MSMLGAAGFRLHDGVTAATLDDGQMHRIVMGADPKAVVFDVQTVEVEGTAVEVKRLREEWIDLRNQLLWFEALYREDVKRREAPSKARKKRKRIVARAKSLRSLVADDPGLSHHLDALSQLITDASIRPSENPELDERAKTLGLSPEGNPAGGLYQLDPSLMTEYHAVGTGGYVLSADYSQAAGSAFEVTICDRLKPAFHEFFERSYSTDPDSGEVSGPLIRFALAVCKELRICKADGKLPDAAAIKGALGYKTRRKESIP